MSMKADERGAEPRALAGPMTEGRPARAAASQQGQRADRAKATVNVRSGSRVYWHGVFPDPAKQGTVKAPGTMHHEVLWDGRTESNMVAVDALGKIVGERPTCPYTGGCGRCPR